MPEAMGLGRGQARFAAQTGWGATFRGAVLADFLNGRGDNRRAVTGVMKFQIHAAADEAHLEHRTAPGGTGDGDLNGLWTVLWMARDERRTLAQHQGGVEVMLG